MEIQALTLVVTDQDLNSIVKAHAPRDLGIEELRLHITPEGVHVTGEYPLFVTVAFETLWEPLIRDGKVVARLAKLRAMGLPVNVLKSAILKLARDQVRNRPGVTVTDEHLLIDVEELARREGVALRANLKGILCLEGQMHILCGAGSA